MNSITLSDKQVFINPVTASLAFKCRYLADINWASEQFAVKGAAAAGEDAPPRAHRGQGGKLDGTARSIR